jgi:hypothetical protein
MYIVLLPSTVDIRTQKKEITLLQKEENLHLYFLGNIEYESMVLKAARRPKAMGVRLDA